MRVTPFFQMGTEGSWSKGKLFQPASGTLPPCPSLSPPPPHKPQAGGCFAEKGTSLSLSVFWRRQNWTWHLVKRICISQTAPGIATFPQANVRCSVDLKIRHSVKLDPCQATWAMD